MAHFAEIDSDNKVLRVLVVDNSQEHRGQEFLANDLGLGGTWIQTSYNTAAGVNKNGGIPLRKNYAGIGSIYDPIIDAFYAPKPFESWILNEETCVWEPPIAKPDDDNFYIWNESTVSWDLTE